MRVRSETDASFCRGFAALAEAASGSDFAGTIAGMARRLEHEKANCRRAIDASGRLVRLGRVTTLCGTGFPHQIQLFLP